MLMLPLMLMLMLRSDAAMQVQPPSTHQPQLSLWFSTSPTTPTPTPLPPHPHTDRDQLRSARHDARSADAVLRFFLFSFLAITQQEKGWTGATINTDPPPPPPSLPPPLRSLPRTIPFSHPTLILPSSVPALTARPSRRQTLPASPHRWTERAPRCTIQLF